MRLMKQVLKHKMSIPILDLSLAENHGRQELLSKLKNALFNVGFLYITHHGVDTRILHGLADMLPDLFSLADESKKSLSKLNSPHFLGYNGYAEETTAGERDLREQFDFATELPLIWKIDDLQSTVETGAIRTNAGRDFSKLYW